MTLHLITTSALFSPSLGQCLAQLADDDGLVLLEDGVYALSAPQWQQQLKALDQPVYVLDADCYARGLKTAEADFDIIDMQKLVELSLTFSRTLTWT